MASAEQCLALCVWHEAYGTLFLCSVARALEHSTSEHENTNLRIADRCWTLVLPKVAKFGRSDKSGKNGFRKAVKLRKRPPDGLVVPLCDGGTFFGVIRGGNDLARGHLQKTRAGLATRIWTKCWTEVSTQTPVPIRQRGRGTPARHWQAAGFAAWLASEHSPQASCTREPPPRPAARQEWLRGTQRPTRRRRCKRRTRDAERERRPPPQPRVSDPSVHRRHS